MATNFDKNVYQALVGIAGLEEEPIEFDYQLFCNKICGASHYNMGMIIVVESEKDYNAWLAKQKAIRTIAAK